MSPRPIALALLTLLAAASAACADATAPAPSGALTPTASSRDLTDPATCRTGWNSSTGRCE